MIQPRSNGWTVGRGGEFDFEFDTHPGRARLKVETVHEVLEDDDQELSDEIVVRLWLARLRALEKAFPTRA